MAVNSDSLTNDSSSTNKEELGKKIIKVLRFYFCQGQNRVDTVKHDLDDLPLEHRIIRRYRRLLGILIPFCFFHFVWWTTAINYDLLILFKTHYTLSIVMVFGAFFKGLSCEGGSAVIFPALTLALHIRANTARDFTLMIQSCGLSAASFGILWMGIRVEWRSIVFTSMGAVIGLLVSLEHIVDYISPSIRIMLFVSICFSFAVTLFILNLNRNRPRYDEIQDFKWWKLATLLINGFIGGFVTAMAGSGVDVFSFIILTLFFGVSEKVAAPTSVILMAFQGSMAFYWRCVMMRAIPSVCWEYLFVCVPVVTIFAPIGSLVASHFHPQLISIILYILESTALIGGFAVVKPGIALGLSCAGFILASILVLYVMTKVGAKQFPVDHGAVADAPTIKSVSMNLQSKVCPAPDEYMPSTGEELVYKSNFHIAL